MRERLAPNATVCISDSSGALCMLLGMRGVEANNVTREGGGAKCCDQKSGLARRHCYVLGLELMLASAKAEPQLATILASCSGCRRNDEIMARGERSALGSASFLHSSDVDAEFVHLLLDEDHPTRGHQARSAGRGLQSQHVDRTKLERKRSFDFAPLAALGFSGKGLLLSQQARRSESHLQGVGRQGRIGLGSGRRDGHQEEPGHWSSRGNSFLSSKAEQVTYTVPGRKALP